MNGHASEAQLHKLAEGELVDGEREKVEAHVRRCDRCRGKYESYRGEREVIEASLQLFTSLLQRLSGRDLTLPVLHSLESVVYVELDRFGDLLESIIESRLQRLEADVDRRIRQLEESLG